MDSGFGKFEGGNAAGDSAADDQDISFNTFVHRTTP
jgi:hypothetical protein